MLHSSAFMIQTLFEILLMMCICFDVMLGLSYYTHSFFACMKQTMRSETTVQRQLRRLWRQTRRWRNCGCLVRITHPLSLFSHDSRFVCRIMLVCVWRRKARKKKECEICLYGPIRSRSFLLQIRWFQTQMIWTVLHSSHDSTIVWDIVDVWLFWCDAWAF